MCNLTYVSVVAQIAKKCWNVHKNQKELNLIRRSSSFFVFRLNFNYRHSLNDTRIFNENNKSQYPLKINKKCRKFKQFPAFFGRGDGDRTHDLSVPNAARYQLRYASIFQFFIYFRKWSNMWSNHSFRDFFIKLYWQNCQVFQGVQRFAKLANF